MTEFLTYIPIVSLTLLANFAMSNRGLALLTYSLLALGNALLLAVGLLALGPGGALIEEQSGLGAAAVTAMGWSLIATALVASSFLITPVRRAARRFALVSDQSPVDGTALVLGADLIGLSVVQLILLPLVWESMDQALVTPTRLWIQGFFFTTIGLLSVGFPMRRSVEEASRRLGLTAITPRHVTWIAGAVLAAVVGNIAAQAAWQRFLPESYLLFESQIQGLFQGFDTPAGLLAVGLSAGIGEEILFRGALQPRLGLIPTSILFAVIHSYYGVTPAFAWIVILGLGLGVLRQRTSTTACIVFHAAYNTLTFIVGR